jgi:hypothetical protein
MKVACVVKFQDIDSDLECGDNAGGVIKVFPFFHKDVNVWPTIPVASEGMTLEEYATLVGDLIFKAGKCATQFKLPPNKGSFEIVELGEQGGISHQMELTIYQHGITKTMLGMMGVTKNAKMGFLVIDSNKNAFLMGDEDTGAYRDKGEGAKTGTARTDVAGTSLKFVYPVNNPRMYEGDTVLILKPAPAT